MDRIEQLRVTVIPRWTYQAMLLNGLALSDVHDYGKMRKALALNDIEDLVVSNQIVNIGGRPIATAMHPFDTDKITPEQNLELQNSVLPKLGVESSACYAREKLTGLSPDFDQYKIEKSNHTLYVVVPEGFIGALETNVFQLKFIREFLKQCYSMASVSYVDNNVPLFKVYVNLISQKA